MKPGHDPAAAVAHIRAQTDKAFAGEPTGDMAFDALGFLLTEVAIPRAIIDDIIAGFELDAKDWRPRSEDDLLRYSYHVAGAVGVAMARSEERRVGKEGVSTCRSRWSRSH